MVAIGPVDDGHEVRPREQLVWLLRLVGADEAPLHHLAEVGVRPVGRRPGSQREAGGQVQDHDQGQQEGRRPPVPAVRA